MAQGRLWRQLISVLVKGMVDPPWSERTPVNPRLHNDPEIFTSLNVVHLPTLSIIAARVKVDLDSQHHKLMVNKPTTNTILCLHHLPSQTTDLRWTLGQVMRVRIVRGLINNSILDLVMKALRIRGRNTCRSRLAARGRDAVLEDLGLVLNLLGMEEVLCLLELTEDRATLKTQDDPVVLVAETGARLITHFQHPPAGR